MKNIIKCPICDSLKTKLKLTTFDDRYGFPGDFTLYTCNNCKHIFLPVNFSEEEIKKLYTDYYPRSILDPESYSPHKEQYGLNAWLEGIKASAFRWVPPKVKILDIGCGFGETLGYHNNRGCETYGVEVDENVNKIAEKYNLNIKIGFHNPKDYKSGYFDYITLDQVLEHERNPVKLLMNLTENLKENGKIIISCPNGNGIGNYLFRTKYINWHLPYHLHFFSKKSMKLCASKAGFKIINKKTVTPSVWLHFQWLHLFHYPKKNSKSNFWSLNHNNKLTLKKKVIIRIIYNLRKFKMDHIYARFFDALRIGDNFIFILEKE